jgi:pantoate--beta-alanine ligase
MTILHQPSLLQDHLSQYRSQGKRIGFVPTMGALHQGHEALVKQSVASNDITVCSIFVNPTQFNDMSDYKKYPNRLENDIRILIGSGADILFLPPVEAIYPNGISQLEHYDIGYLETLLEGKYRPGHFQGVCQVMNRLIGFVEPDNLVMGQKDYQQCMVIKKLLALTNRNTELITSPTVREHDGLAMSSRNLRLSPEHRSMAPMIYQALGTAKQKLAPGDLQPLKRSITLVLQEAGFKVDYFEIAHVQTLQLMEMWDGSTPLVALAAAYAGDVRLIDNLLLNS